MHMDGQTELGSEGRIRFLRCSESKELGMKATAYFVIHIYKSISLLNFLPFIYSIQASLSFSSYGM